MARRSLAVLFAIALVGCGPKVPFGVVPVSGKVTYDDGTPIKAHRVTIDFISQMPAKGKEHPKPGSASVEADGTFKNVTTWNPFDGAIVGKHKVVIKSLDNVGMASPEVPAEYTDPSKTPIEIEVPPGGGTLKDITVKKPTK